MYFLIHSLPLCVEKTANTSMVIAQLVIFTYLSISIFTEDLVHTGPFIGRLRCCGNIVHLI